MWLRNTPGKGGGHMALGLPSPALPSESISSASALPTHTPVLLKMPRSEWLVPSPISSQPSSFTALNSLSLVLFSFAWIHFPQQVVRGSQGRKQSLFSRCYLCSDPASANPSHVSLAVALPRWPLTKVACFYWKWDFSPFGLPNTTGWVAYRQQKFISHNSGGWGIQDQGANRFGVWRDPASWFMDVVFSCGRRGKRAYWGLF